MGTRVALRQQEVRGVHTRGFPVVVDNKSSFISLRPRWDGVE